MKYIYKIFFPFITIFSNENKEFFLNSQEENKETHEEDLFIREDEIITFKERSMRYYSIKYIDSHLFCKSFIVFANQIIMLFLLIAISINVLDNSKGDMVIKLWPLMLVFSYFLVIMNTYFSYQVYFNRCYIYYKDSYKTRVEKFYHVISNITGIMLFLSSIFAAICNTLDGKIFIHWDIINALFLLMMGNTVIPHCLINSFN